LLHLCKEEPPAQAGGFLFRTAMLRNRFPESPPASREGMAEMFTLQRLKLPPSLYKCLATTNLIESPQSGRGAPDRQFGLDFRTQNRDWNLARESN